MEEVCRNCEHFMQVSITSTEHQWGDCRKSANGTGQTGSEIPGLFKWGDATCSDFEPRQEAE
ncbi:MAG: hypothetical protein ACYS6W_10765 [Planctomycetota bacterium]|jgi:hypothetical protein